MKRALPPDVEGLRLPDITRPRSDSLSTPLAPVYRVILLAEDGAVKSVVRITVDDDDRAIEVAQAMVDGHAVELWDGLRFIEHFPAVD